jgi:1-acyl-sn-glycerol-3-phosphate acyltransferase
MALIRSIAFALLFYTGSLIAVLSAFPLLLVGPRAVRRHAARWAGFHRWCTRHLLGIRGKGEGSAPPGPVLFAAKHQSMYETIELVRMLDRPAIVLKQELIGIPLWGRIAQGYGVIPVDRAGSASALRAMVVAARAALAEGRSVLIFPEGTRVAPGEQPELRAGFAGLYRALNLPVVPIALDSGKVSPRNSFIKHSGVVTFRFGEAIPPGLPRAEVERQVHAAINALEGV